MTWQNECLEKNQAASLPRQDSLLFSIACISLICLSFTAFLGKAYETTLRGIDSNIHAKASMSVTASAQARSRLEDWKPQLPIPASNMSPERRPLNPPLKFTQAHSQVQSPPSYFNDHPFLFFWINGWVMRAFHPSSWSARILTASFSTGCVILVLLLGIALHSRLYGLLSALIFLLTRDTILTGATVSLDPPMLFFILLSFLLWIQQKWVAMSLVAGIGLWIKTPLVLLIYPTAGLLALIHGNLKSELKRLIPLLTCSLLIGSLVWLALGLIGGWEFVQDYWIRQFWGTAVYGRNLGTKTEWFMFFRMVRNGFLPGLPLLLLAPFFITRSGLWKSKAVEISMAATFVVIVLLSPMRFKMDYYFNPTLPFLSLLAAFSLIEFLTRLEDQFYATVTAGTCLLCSFLLCTPTSLGPEPFVALRKFIPFIQSYGSCGDSIVLVPGGEPIGSSSDYQLALNFYTGRSVFVEGCQSIGPAIRKSAPQWLILSEENYNQCLTAAEKKSFQSQIKMGHQLLLSNQIPANASRIDLSLLERELKPVTDCIPEPYPKDAYH